MDTNYHDTYFVMGSMLLVSRYGGAGRVGTSGLEGHRYDMAAAMVVCLTGTSHAQRYVGHSARAGGGPQTGRPSCGLVLNGRGRMAGTCLTLAMAP